MDFCCPRIVESSHSLKRAEMMIERTVFLHQYDDVLNIFNRAGAVICRDVHRLSDICFQRGQRGERTARQLQEFTSIDRHGVVLVSENVKLKKIANQVWLTASIKHSQELASCIGCRSLPMNLR